MAPSTRLLIVDDDPSVRAMLREYLGNHGFEVGEAGSGDEIWVAAGVYKPTSGADRTAAFHMKNGVTILGGFPATGNPGENDRNWKTNVSTLSGDIGVAGDNGDNSYNVVNNHSLNSSAVLDGFTITGGNAYGATQEQKTGGGMLNSSSSATSWARPVMVPWPISERAMRMTTVSSGLITTQALISGAAPCA